MVTLNLYKFGSYIKNPQTNKEYLVNLVIQLKSETRQSKLIEASHLINIVEVLCRLSLLEGNIEDTEAMVSDMELRISMYE